MSRTFYIDDHDAIAGIAHHGSAGAMRAAEAMRAAAPMPEDSQILMDEAVVGVGRQRLVLVDDLINAGLVRPLPNWISVMELGHSRRSDHGHAQRSMDL